MTLSKSSFIGLAAIFSAVFFASAAKAQNFQSFVSNHGLDTNSCTAIAPCATIETALSHTMAEGIISCLDSGNFSRVFLINVSITIDCADTAAMAGPFRIGGSGITVVIKNMTISGFGFNDPGIDFQQGAGLVVDNVHFQHTLPGINVGTSTPVNITVTNSIMENGSAGILIKPSMGATVSATLDHVTITQNSGGGLKTDTTVGGAVIVNISNSVISHNGGNGLNAVSGAGGPNNMLNLSHNIVASNGTAGIQANGTNAAALVDDTSLLNNTNGALSTVAGGRLFTYGNNRIVGSAGSGFTGTALHQ